jgi:hypothetical protein
MKLATILFLFGAVCALSVTECRMFEIKNLTEGVDYAIEYGEPEQTGGATCDSNAECNSAATIRAKEKNYCAFDIPQRLGDETGRCVCSYRYAMVDCSHKRYDKNVAGGLEFLAFAGIGGVGNFVAGLISRGMGQLLLMMYPIWICFFLCLSACCVAATDDDDAGFSCAAIGQCVVGCMSLVGFIWCMVNAGQFLSGNVLDGDGYYPFEA